MGRDIDAKIIEQRVIEIINVQMFVDKAEIRRKTSFIKDLDANFFDAVDLIEEFEYEFGISIPEEEAEKIQTVGDAIDYIFNVTQVTEGLNLNTSRINEIAEYFVNEPKLYRPEDIINQPKLIPNKKGIYGWYFDELPPEVHDADYFEIEGYKLLYVGIAGENVNSKNDLRTRICTVHLKDDASVSTLRKSLGALLRKKLAIQLTFPPKSVPFVIRVPA
jgi:acyl carrier protein